VYGAIAYIVVTWYNHIVMWSTTDRK